MRGGTGGHGPPGSATTARNQSPAARINCRTGARRMKQYDQSLFDKWDSGRGRVHDDSDVRQKVSLAVATTEYFIRRPIRSVLDIGCGEGAWHEHLRVLRPRVHYQGLDPSEYAVERF